MTARKLPNGGFMTARKLPKQVDAIVCAALNLGDIAMTNEQRALADEIYMLASRLEETYTECTCNADAANRAIGNHFGDCPLR